MNKEIKVIDLLNMIANGKNIKSIKYQNHIYEYYNGDYRGKNDSIYDSNWLFANEIIDLNNLNDEVEIIEEDNNKIEKLKHTTKCTGIDEDGTYYTNEFTTIELAAKIDEIIEKINNME